jgi:hypothetical protein
MIEFKKACVYVFCVKKIKNKNKKQKIPKIKKPNTPNNTPIREYNKEFIKSRLLIIN